MPGVMVTKDMLANMEFDTQPAKVKKTTAMAGDKKWVVLIVFAKSDINAALHHLVKSLESPFEPQSVATVLVQEAIKEDFIEKLQKQLKPYENEDIKNEDFSKALETITKLNGRIITAENSQKGVVSPTLVCDFTHEQLGSIVPSGVVTLHTFRTAREAISLVNKESITFDCVSIWHENHGLAYEFVLLLKSAYYFINCYQVAVTVLEESISKETNYVTIDKFYHYETLKHEGIQKSIVFPIGSIFAN